MDTQKQQIVDNLKQANNILVTVSNNPSIDQLAACIGLTLALNKMKKHATAVFSGNVPSIIEFLEPEKTLEKTTDSLRDFIIAIDKAKADKLRYKVEDKFVKIFITPYRTSISDKDLQFSEGDFNVDVVLALGVHKQTDLDQAITAHGRILHDATVVSVNNQPNIELGSINLLEPQASSLSEIAVQLLDLLDKSMIDNQIATALLTGIVAETDRFRNAKTTPTTMSISAELLTAGANQQLVASKLEAPAPAPAPIAQMPSAGNAQQAIPANRPDDGMLEINHDERSNNHSVASHVGQNEAPKPPQIHIDESGHVHSLGDTMNTNIAPTSAPLNDFGLPPLPPVLSGSLQDSVASVPSPFNGPLSPPTQPMPLSPPTPPRVEPPVVSSAIIQPDLNASQPMLPPLPPVLSGSLQDSVASVPSPFNGPLSPPPLSSLPPLQPIEPAVSPFPSLDTNRSPSPLNPFATPSPTSAPLNDFGLPPLPSNQPPVIHTDGPRLMMQPPTFGSQLTAGTMPQDEDEEGPSGAAISLPQIDNPTPLLQREPLQPQSNVSPVSPAPSVSLPPPPPPKVAPSAATSAPGGDQSVPPLLADGSRGSLTRDVKSPHLDYVEPPIPNLPVESPVSPAPSVSLPPPPPPTPVVDEHSTLVTPSVLPAEQLDDGTYSQEADVKSARSAIEEAFDGGGDAEDSPLEPVVALNAQPLGAPLHEFDNPDAPPPGFSSDPNVGTPPPPPVPPPLIPPSPS
jgi:hypothetical protein